MKLPKILYILPALIFFSCGSDLSYEQQVTNYNFYIKKSDSLIEQKNYNEAMSYINSAIKITDTIPIAIYLKGFVSYKLDRLDDAEKNFTKAIEMEGEKSKTYKDRAKVYLKMGDSDFLDDINFHIENYPNDEEALTLKRDYLENKEDYDEAINEYNLAINKNKNDISLLTKRADLYFKNGDYEKSIQDYEQVLKLNPDNENIKTKKNDVLLLINNNSNRNILFAILISFYLIYVATSFFILKPLANKKAINQIGGEFEISKDPLIWVLPIVLTIIFLTIYFLNIIPNFK
ncbi:tetratricopeptide repeat protein [Algibacter sp. Ld11]|uniref:tetratricopeptide repeat protein n=1 Tax=Algibacter sp. Ld11 TaxID=649150 RepID=UPI003868E9CA